MALEESDREDLLRQATGLGRRVEISRDGSDPLVAGFRSDGCLSLFFGADPVLQFDSSRRLRRAFHQAVRYAAFEGRLVSLHRGQRGGRIQLLHQAVDTSKSSELIADWSQRIASLPGELTAARRAIAQGVPDANSVLAALDEWLASTPLPLALSSAPNAR